MLPFFAVELVDCANLNYPEGGMDDSDAIEITNIELSGDVEMEWDQHAGETNLQYKKFRTYLEMDREDRTVRASFKRYGELYAGKEGVVIGAFTQWQEISVNQRWAERARAYDRWIDVKILEKLANRRLNSLVEIADLGAKLRRTAAKALESLRFIIKDEVFDPETKEVTYETRSTIAPADIARLAQAGMEMEQLAIGAPTSRNSITPPSDDSTLTSMASAKALITKKIEQIAARRSEANTASHQLQAGIEQMDSAGEITVEATVDDGRRAGKLGALDYEIEIDTETPSPEDVRLAKIRAGEL